MSIIERRNCKRRMSGIEKMGMRRGHFSESLSWDEGDWNSAIRTLLAQQQQIMMRLGPSLCTELNQFAFRGHRHRAYLSDRNTLNVTRTPRMYNYDITSSSRQRTQLEEHWTS
jgi:hypothetical protein